MELFTTDRRHQHQPAAIIGACDRHSLVPSQMCSAKQMASKLTTSSCSNTAVGEKVASSTIEPASQHSRHGRRESKRDQRHPLPKAIHLSTPSDLSSISEAPRVV